MHVGFPFGFGSMFAFATIASVLGASLQDAAATEPRKRPVPPLAGQTAMVVNRSTSPTANLSDANRRLYAASVSPNQSNASAKLQAASAVTAPTMPLSAGAFVLVKTAALSQPNMAGLATGVAERPALTQIAVRRDAEPMSSGVMKVIANDRNQSSLASNLGNVLPSAQKQQAPAAVRSDSFQSTVAPVQTSPAR
ncbi:MAG: hypothetical protein ACLQOQ_17360 [Beijerinckiaceae bacterium]